MAGRGAAGQWREEARGGAGVRRAEEAPGGAGERAAGPGSVDPGSVRRTAPEVDPARRRIDRHGSPNSGRQQAMPRPARPARPSSHAPHPEDSSVLRDRTAGSLRSTDDGATVTLAGWVARRRDHGGVIFIDLRDASGVVQVVFHSGDASSAPTRCAASTACRSPGPWRSGPEGNENPDLPTGEIEVEATELEVLSESAPLPFQIDDTITVGEETRLKYRYLDLRRAGPAAALRLRSAVNRAARTVLDDQDFVEIETPTLTRSTPEGARDFLVPARLQPGSWYALPQSPQLFKQLLMVAGMERYYQIARCYRDEDFRADRQPEFTQLDIEMSSSTRTT